MLRRRLFKQAAAATVLAAAATPGQAEEGAASLDPVLLPYLAAHKLPAFAAAVVRGGRIVAVGAVGTRRAGTDIPVTRQDRFHIGSDTKAMTALTAAMLVEAGKLRWASTAGGAFPEFAATMDAGLRGVTLEQLLSHTSGLSDAALGMALRQSFTGGDERGRRRGGSGHPRVGGGDLPALWPDGLKNAHPS